MPGERSLISDPNQMRNFLGPLSVTRVLSMQPGQLQNLSPSDKSLAQNILESHKSGQLGSQDIVKKLLGDSHRYSYDSALPLTENLSNFGSNFMSGSKDLLVSLGEALASPIDTFEGVATAASGAIANVQDFIEEETDFFKPGVLSGLKQQRAENPEFAEERAQSQQVAGKLGGMISGLGQAAVEAPGNFAFRHPAELAAAGVPVARAAGAAKLGRGARAALAVADLPGTALKGGAKAAGLGGRLLGGLAQRGAKALSGTGTEKQGLIREIATQPSGRPAAMGDMLDPGGRLASGAGNQGLNDAIRRGQGSVRVPLEPGQSPSIIGQGASLQDDIVNSVQRTKQELHAQATIAIRQVKELQRRLKVQRQQATQGPAQQPIRDFTGRQDPNQINPILPELPPSSLPGPVRKMDTRPLNTIDETGNVINRPAGATPGSQTPEKLVSVEDVRQAQARAAEFKELSEVIDELFPADSPLQTLEIPQKVANLTNKGSEFHLNKVREAADITGIPILPRGVGFSVSSGSTSSLAGANIAIEAMRQPVSWALAAGAGALSTQIGPQAFGLLIAVPFTSPRLVTRVLQANGWTRQQIKPIVKMTRDIMKIPGMEARLGQGVTYGTLMQEMGISQEDLLRGNDN